jgi:hypothetical protein
MEPKITEKRVANDVKVKLFNMGRLSLLQASTKLEKYKEEGIRGEVLLTSRLLFRDVVIAAQIGRKLRIRKTMIMMLTSNFESSILFIKTSNFESSILIKLTNPETFTLFLPRNV